MSKLRDLPALQIIRVDADTMRKIGGNADGWAVVLDEGCVAVFPEYETALAFVEAVRNGTPPDEALQMVLGGKAQ